MQNVREVPGAEVADKLRVLPPSTMMGSHGCRSRLRVAALQDPAVRTAFNADLTACLAMPGEAVTFDSLSRALREAGVNTLRLEESSQPDWRRGNEHVLRELAAARQSVLDAARAAPGDFVAQAALREARDEVRALKNAWWQERLASIEFASRGRNARRLFGEAKELGRILAQQGLSRRPLLPNPAVAAARLADHFERGPPC